MTQPTLPEFSRPIAVDGVEDEGHAFRIQAEEEEREALARRFGLVSLKSLVGQGVILPEANNTLFRLEVRLIAEFVQSCVVSLKPVCGRLDVTFQRLYGPDVENEWTDKEHSGREVFLNLEDDLVPEPLTDETIDLGEAVAEQFALELDPFPRAADTIFEGFPGCTRDVSEETEGDGPFAALAALRGKPVNQA